MSIWRSIEGENPVTYDTSNGEIVDNNGWVDVAVFMFGNRVRLIIEDSGGDGRVSVDLAGLDELLRRMNEARVILVKENLWER